MKVLTPIDDYLLARVTALTKWYIRRNEYKKHKIDLRLFFNGLISTLWGLGSGVFVGLLIAHKSYLTIICIIAILAMILFMQIQRRLLLLELREEYDVLWANRHDRRIYESLKHYYEQEYQQEGPYRRTMLLFNLILVGYSAFILSPYFFAWVAMTIEMYFPYVFELDEPEAIERAPESLTDIVKNAWQRIVEAAIPVKNGI